MGWDFITTVQTEWPVIQQAPWIVAGIVLLSVSIGWTVGRFMGNEKIGNLQSRLDRRDDEIAALKAKAAQSPGSPDRKALRIVVGRILNECEDLQARCRKIGEEPPTEAEINAWAEKSAITIAENLDESYAHRFNS